MSWKKHSVKYKCILKKNLKTLNSTYKLSKADTYFQKFFFTYILGKFVVI